MLESTLERFWQHRDRQALARLLTLVARDEQIPAIRNWLANRPARKPGASGGRVIAITGAGGVGKSTLIGKLIEVARGQSKSLAVLACDPQSSLTGGALLGDRIRMPSCPDDLGVFIRSIATPSGHEAIAPNLDLMIRLIELYGFDTIIVETAGAGQGDTAVRNLARVVVLLVQPEAGDELQWEKAGLLEVADIVVVHKADLLGAQLIESQLREQLNPPGARTVPVLRVSSNKGEGAGELWDAIETALAHRPA